MVGLAAELIYLCIIEDSLQPALTFGGSAVK